MQRSDLRGQGNVKVNSDWLYGSKLGWQETKIGGFKDAELIKAEAVGGVSKWEV